MKSDKIWLKAAVVLSVLPLVAWPSLLAEHGSDVMVWLYAAVTAAYGFLAWKCGPERPVLAWVLVVMSLLTSAAIWML